MFMQVRNFSKIQSKIFENYCFENIATFCIYEAQSASNIKSVTLFKNFAKIFFRYTYF